MAGTERDLAIYRGSSGSFHEILQIRRGKGPEPMESSCGYSRMAAPVPTWRPSFLSFSRRMRPGRFCYTSGRLSAMNDDRGKGDMSCGLLASGPSVSAGVREVSFGRWLLKVAILHTGSESRGFC